MSEQIVFPDDWRKRLKDAVLVAVDVDWRRVHGELEKELESWPRVQVPASEDGPLLFRCSREKHVYGQVPCEHCEPADSHEPVASSDPSDEWCGRCDRHLNVCEAFGDLGAFREDEHGNVVNADGDIVETAYYRSNAYQSDPEPASQSHPKPAECDCYPFGVSYETYEGPQEHCKVHGPPSAPTPSHLQVTPSLGANDLEEAAEPNDWTPAKGEWVEGTTPVAGDHVVGTYRNAMDEATAAIFVGGDRYLPARVLTSSLRPAPQDSERAEQ